MNVADNQNGALTATSVIHKVGAAAAVQTAKFVNEYFVTGEGAVTIGGEKKLDGGILVAEEFDIGLYSDAACTAQLAQTSNRADGTFAFPEITYTAADLGNNHSEKTYTYYVQEIIPADAVKNAQTGKYEKNGVTYDDTVHTVTVTVSHNNGVLEVTPSGNYNTLQINNIYKAQSVDVTLSGRKELSGDWTAVANKDFTFQLFKADSNFAITDTNPVKQVTVTGAQDFAMTLSYIDGNEGMYYYVLKEDTSAQAGGVNYDAGEYHITVNISDPGNGQLWASSTIYRPGTGNTTVAVFTNVYEVAPTTITLEGTKKFTNLSTGQPITMEGGEFEFLVLDGVRRDTAKVVTTGTNRTDGSIAFLPITYAQAGVHNYTVVETTGGAGGVKYSDAQFNVKVAVTDNGDGTLTATADYGNTPVVFENTYNPNAAQVVLSGSKTFAGDWSGITNKVFNFQLFETGADFAVTGEAISSASNNADGSLSFGAINYAKAGKHYYVLREEFFGQTKQGITYDGKEVHITVTVTDDGSGQLIAQVTTNDSAAVITTENNVVSVSGLKFTNSAPEKPATPQTGDNMNLVLVTVLMLSSVACLFVLVISRKRLVG